MKLKSITIGGFKNLRKTKIQLNTVIAVISPNNYGKSNLLEAIDFGTDFMTANSKDRKTMMRYARGIPINKENANDEFFFEIEFQDDSLGDYRFVKYGYSFMWYRDDGTGMRITDEWIEARATESVRYTSFLKYNEGKYRKEKNTSSFRKINFEAGQLAIDVLSSLDDIEIAPVISSIKRVNYHICSSLDLGDRFQPSPVEYVDYADEGSIAFDDKDVPRALFKLKNKYPEKYGLFLEAIFNLFPEFTDVNVQSYELKKEFEDVSMIITDTNGTVSELSLNELNANTDIPFKIKDELYRVLISSRHLNQPINMSMMSTGTKRVFWLLENVFVASSKEMSFIGIEELETSIHPRLLKLLLETLYEELEDTSVIVSSHSPFLVQYIKPENIYVGVPNDEGVAEFRRIAPNKIKSLVVSARNNGMAVGEYLFELLSGDSDSIELLSLFLEAQ